MVSFIPGFSPPAIHPRVREEKPAHCALPSLPSRSPKSAAFPCDDIVTKSITLLFVAAGGA